MSSHETLSAAAQDRKARLAQLKSLKRKQAPTDENETSEETSTALTTSSDASANPTEDALTAPSTTQKYLSGRNYDHTTSQPKLGFDNIPIKDPTQTLEHKASALALDSKQQQDQEQEDASSGAGLDLFKLQPKKPNWDLKRDLNEKYKALESETDRVVAALVRERVEAQARAKREVEGATKKIGNGETDGEEVGMEGSELVEVMHLKEREEEEERRREEEDDVV